MFSLFPENVDSIIIFDVANLAPRYDGKLSRALQFCKHGIIQQETASVCQIAGSNRGLTRARFYLSRIYSVEIA